MKFSDIENSIDRLSSSREKIRVLERALPSVRGNELRKTLLVLANEYAFERKFKRAAELYEVIGFDEEAKNAKGRS